MGYLRKRPITFTKKTLGMEFTILNKIPQKRVQYFSHIQWLPITQLPQLALYIPMSTATAPEVEPKRDGGQVPSHRPLKRLNIPSLANATHVVKKRQT